MVHIRIPAQKEADNTPSSDHIRSWAQQHYEQWAKPKYDLYWIGLLLLFETVVCLACIRLVSYTEIDWKAYMQEVQAYQDGERNYMNIRGDTGPLVYPAGFVYLFSFLKDVTNQSVERAQYIFMAIYLMTQATVLAIYQMVLRDVPRTTCGVWKWRCGMAVLCLSKRLHSIYVLRLFNDGPTMLLLYVSVLCFMRYKWNVGCIIFSLAVSVKMNVLLFAPGLLLLLLQVSKSLPETIFRIGFYCGVPQLILGYPFLSTYPIQYLRKSFELDRTFFYEWTVNWKFLGEKYFVSKQLSIILLVGHLTGLVFLLYYKWKPELFCGKDQRLAPTYIAVTLLVSNFVGICFARTLHYQFYSWYVQALPLLLWSHDTYPIGLRLCILSGTELAFLTFPATDKSSLLLHLCHFLVLIQVSRPLQVFTSMQEEDAEEEPPIRQHHLRGRDRKNR